MRIFVMVKEKLTVYFARMERMTVGIVMEVAGTTVYIAMEPVGMTVYSALMEETIAECA